ncbi:MAG: DUF1877 family protein [Kofleriaceae bacterium]
MASKCNLFSIDESELDGGADTLPRYDEQVSIQTHLRPPHILQLGGAWAAVHAALGNHDADCVLGFLGAGGTVFGLLEDGPRSSGRYFDPAQVRTLRDALERVSEDGLTVDVRAWCARVRKFIAEAEDQGRGIVVHHMR